MRPYYQIQVDGQDLTDLLMDRNTDISITSQAGVGADSLQITFEAGDGVLVPFTKIPPKGIDVTVAFGYESGQNLDAPYDLSSMGTFKLTEIKLTAFPYLMKLFATSVNTANTFKMAVNDSYHNVTIKDIVGAAAKACGYELKIDQNVAARYIRHFDQRGLSHMAMLKRLAATQGCDCKVVDDKTLLFGPFGTLSLLDGTNSANKQQNLFTLQEGMCSDWEYTGQSRSLYKTVTAKFYDKDRGVADNVSTPVASADDKAKAVYEISRAYPSKEEAQTAAASKANALAKSAETFTFTVGGCPLLKADSVVKMTQWYPDVPKAWHVVSAVHTFGKEGVYTTSCECERLKVTSPFTQSAT